MTDAVAVQTLTVGEGDDLITYDVRGDLADATADRPALFILGSPMEASYFAPLAEHFSDRPVITYDPRGTARNPHGTSPLTPEQHAEDIHRVVEAVGGGPVDVFASSGGAVNTLALVAAHPDDVRRAVAHEPPTAALLPDRESVLAVVDEMRATYDAEGNGPAMAKFIALVMLDGEVPGDYLERPAPDPAMFGMSAEDDGSRDNPLMRNLGPCNRYEPDLDALAALGDRLVIAAGEDSGQQLAARGGYTVAARLGSEIAIFPKGHGGFLPGDGDPDGFAARLHEVLDQASD
jgi:pimeloyl-ACP methyl ester carboxylesterase